MGLCLKGALAVVSTVLIGQIGASPFWAGGSAEGVQYLDKDPSENGSTGLQNGSLTQEQRYVRIKKFFSMDNLKNIFSCMQAYHNKHFKHSTTELKSNRAISPRSSNSLWLVQFIRLSNIFLRKYKRKKFRASFINNNMVCFFYIKRIIRGNDLLCYCLFAHLYLSMRDQKTIPMGFILMDM